MASRDRHILCPSQHSGKAFAAAALLGASLLSALPAAAQFTPQGGKLVGSDSALNSRLGTSIAVSADGNTLLVGGSGDGSDAGAAWVYVRSAGVWTQQGLKLVGTGAVGGAQQGKSVALSADGNTAAIGGPLDNTFIGAVWIFTRTGNTWTQQGNKLVGSGNTANARQGSSMALSADGNTLITGGLGDGGSVGAAWVFTRTGTTWTQQGNKLVGSGNSGNSQQGSSIALSADGNTALIGANIDAAQVGAAWVFTRSGATWTQQGNKLVGSGNVISRQGESVALSADGNTALIGGKNDDGGIGAAWVFARSGTTWTQQGNKLVGNGYTGTPQQGSGVALSANGNTAAVGGTFDNTGVGALWVFTRSGATWAQQGTKLTAATFNMGSSVAMSPDAGTLAAGAPTDSNKGAAFVFVQPVLTVAPATNITAAGNIGGPFSPPSFDYVLRAPGAAINYSITGVPDWLTATTVSGALTPGGQVTASFTLNATAAAKPAGTLGPVTINFINSTNGLGNTSVSATLTVGNPGTVNVVSAVLPASRSVQVGTAATAFATIINTAGVAGTNCGLGFGSNNAASFKFQTTDPATNAVIGTLNTPVNIPANGSQSFVFAITPSAPLNPFDIPIVAGCSNGAAATSVVGLNTLLLSASAAPVPDIVALGATVGNDGIVNIPGANGTGAFAVATVNVGIAADITASADTGVALLPVLLSLCQTNPGTGQCTSAIGPTVTANVPANATPTFAIFAQAAGAVAFDPAHNRIFVRFKDAGGVVRGATSVAVRTQ